MHNVVTCVYCGHEYPDGTPTAKAEALTEHIQQCEKHPMTALQKRYEIVRAALVGLIGADTKEELQQIECGLLAREAPIEHKAPAIDGVRALLKTLVVLLCCGVCNIASVRADELAEFVKLTQGNRQASGIVVAKDTIMTVAHFADSGKVRAEFFGPEEGVVRRGRVVYADKVRDLAIIRCNTARVRICGIIDNEPVKARRVKVTGFPLNSEDPVEVTASIRGGNPDLCTNGERMLHLVFRGTSGMSGSGAVQDGRAIGIQIGTNGMQTDFASAMQMRIVLDLYLSGKEGN